MKGFSFLEPNQHDQNLKNHFPKGMFQWNLVNVGENIYISIAEIKFGKTILFFKMAAKTFCHIVKQW